MNYESSLAAESDGAAPADDAPPQTAQGVSRRRLFIIGALVLAALLTGALLLREGEGGSAADDADASVPTVSVIVPGMTTINSTIDATGISRRAARVPVARKAKAAAWFPSRSNRANG